MFLKELIYFDSFLMSIPAVAPAGMSVVYEEEVYDV